MTYFNCQSREEEMEMDELVDTRFDTIEEEEEYNRDVILSYQEMEDYEDSHLDDMDILSDLDF